MAEYDHLSDEELLDGIYSFAEGGMPVDGFLISDMSAEARKRGLKIRLPKKQKSQADTNRELIRAGKMIAGLPVPDPEPFKFTGFETKKI